MNSLCSVLHWCCAPEIVCVCVCVCVRARAHAFSVCTAPSIPLTEQLSHHKYIQLYLQSIDFLDELQSIIEREFFQ